MTPLPASDGDFLTEEPPPIGRPGSAYDYPILLTPCHPIAEIYLRQERLQRANACIISVSEIPQCTPASMLCYVSLLGLSEM